MSWRDHLPVHPAADLFPLMSESELRELGEDIKIHSGLRAPIILYQGKLLDGRNRLDAMEMVGITLDWSGDYITKLDGLIFQLDDRTLDPYDYVVSVNLHRRHLTGEQKRELIAKVLKAKPHESNRKIAKQVKADDKTVASGSALEIQSGAAGRGPFMRCHEEQLRKFIHHEALNRAGLRWPPPQDGPSGLAQWWSADKKRRRTITAFTVPRFGDRDLLGSLSAAPAQYRFWEMGNGAGGHGRTPERCG